MHGKTWMSSGPVIRGKVRNNTVNFVSIHLHGEPKTFKQTTEPRLAAWEASTLLY